MTKLDAADEYAAEGLSGRPTFTEYIHHRMNGREPHRPVLDKIDVAEFVQSIGVRVAQKYKIFDHAHEITDDLLPDRCVMKPTKMWNMKGVMLLQRKSVNQWHEGKPLYREMLSGREIELGTIVAEQALCQKECVERDASSDPKIILEELIVDEAGPQLIPLDYKMYCFDGEVRFIHQVNRNVNPRQMAFYRDEFTPVKFDEFMEPELNWAQLGPHRVPRCWHEMLQVAKRVSRALDTPFISVDLYASPSGPVVGELTPTPGGAYFGVWRFRPFFNQQLGDAWTRANVVLGQQGRHFSFPPKRV